ncbi:MAG: DUF3540 domain-containing protein [Pseudomonadota bacterium]
MLTARHLYEAPDLERYLGPARVVTTGADGVQVALPDGEQARATLALALPYEPVPGDELLVIGEVGQFYVIGVLKGAGTTRLAVAGNLDVHAVDGSLRLLGDRGVEVEGNEVAIRTRSLKMHADAVRQKFSTLYRHVRDLCSTRAGRSHAMADETAHSQAERTVILSKETVTVNGQRIQIG